MRRTNETIEPNEHDAQEARATSSYARSSCLCLSLPLWHMIGLRQRAMLWSRDFPSAFPPVLSFARQAAERTGRTTNEAGIRANVAQHCTLTMEMQALMTLPRKDTIPRVQSDEGKRAD
jgi:hypothetical protein